MNFALVMSIILLGGYLSGQLCRVLKIPPLLGMMVFGIGFGLLGLGLSFDRGPKDFWDLFKSLALSVIMLRAGLNLDIDSLKSYGIRPLILGLLPGVIETAVVTSFMVWVLNWPLIDALFLGFLMAALSPAVVFPKLIQNRERGIFPKLSNLIIASTSIDNIYAITGASFVLLLPASSSSEIGIQSLVFFVLSLGAGFGIGALLSHLFTKNNRSVRATEKALVVLAICLGLGALASQFKFTSIPAIVIIGIVLLRNAPKVAHEVGTKLQKLWVVAEILLFTSLGLTIGDSLPTLDSSLIIVSIAVISLGIVARIATSQALVPKRSNLAERILVLSAGIPKATVQATLGGLAIGVNGMHHGNEIFIIAIVSILFSVPIGSVLLEYVTKKEGLKNQS